MIALATASFALGSAPAVRAAEPAAATPDSPFACNMRALTPPIRERHFNQLGPQLRTLVKQVRELPNGYAFEFPSDPASYLLVTEFTAWESPCCPFFDITVRKGRENGALWLELTGRDGVKAFIRDEFAPWMQRS